MEHTYPLSDSSLESTYTYFGKLSEEIKEFIDSLALGDNNPRILILGSGKEGKFANQLATKLLETNPDCTPEFTLVDPTLGIENPWDESDNLTLVPGKTANLEIGETIYLMDQGGMLFTDENINLPVEKQKQQHAERLNKFKSALIERVKYTLLALIYDPSENKDELINEIKGKEYDLIIDIMGIATSLQFFSQALNSYLLKISETLSENGMFILHPLTQMEGVAHDQANFYYTFIDSYTDPASLIIRKVKN